MSEQQKTQWKVLACESLWGYQFEMGMPPEMFCICWCDEDLTQASVAQLRDISGAASLNHFYFIGTGYLEIHMRDHDRISMIFNAMLLTGHWFKTQNAAKVYFDPAKGDNEFSDEIMERKFIQCTRSHILDNERMRQYASAKSTTMLPRQAYKVWNYRTDEGKRMCLELRSLQHRTSVNLASKRNYFLWDAFTNAAALDEQSVSGNAGEKGMVEKPSPEKQHENGEETVECMVCLDRVADTRVEPCGHVVGCATCSEGLKRTADAHICAQCRCPITSVVLLEEGHD